MQTDCGAFCLDDFHEGLATNITPQILRFCIRPLFSVPVSVTEITEGRDELGEKNELGTYGYMEEHE